MKAVVVKKLTCSFCGAKVIETRESFAMRQGVKVRKLLVSGGYLLMTSISSKQPVCSDCWHKAAKYLKANTPNLFMTYRGNLLILWRCAKTWLVGLKDIWGYFRMFQKGSNKHQ